MASAHSRASRPDDVILRAEAISKAFAGTLALDEVTFNIYRGKVNVLVGENGAGKSTLMRILSGAEQPTAGRILLQGEEVKFATPRDAAQRGIGIIHQELNLFPNLSIAENLFAGREPTYPGYIVDRKRERLMASKLLERLEQRLNVDLLAGELPLGLQQLVEIARALAEDVRLLIMDEPTSALSAAEVDILFRVIEDLRDHGVAIVYISHKLGEVQRIGDYVTVLRDGRLIAEARMAEVDTSWIVERMVSRSQRVAFSRAHVSRGATVLQVQELTLPSPGAGLILDSVSFSLHEGEILGIYGLMGAGRTELLGCLMGDQKLARGEVRIMGRLATAQDPASRLGLGVALVPEDRQAEGLFPGLSVKENIVLSSLRRLSKLSILSNHLQDEAAKRMVRDLSIATSDIGRPVSELSGGNQQKSVVGRALLTQPKILLLDEPTRGIDVGAKAEMFGIMGQLADQGLGVIFVSSELKEVLAVSDRILVMARGRITPEFAAEEATENALVQASASREALEALP